jgi:hypothetical protein
MIKTNVKLHLLFTAIIGTFLGYFIITNFVIEMPFEKFFLIEIVITVFHTIYNYNKNKYN